MIRLALLRHGHTAWNRAGRIQGHTDEPLDDEARKQLSDLSLPDQWSEANLVSSPLSRAVETANIVTGRSPHIQKDLIEMNWGKWEGLKGVDLRADPSNGFRDIESWGWNYCPPNGESPRQLRNRLEPWILGLKQDTVAVCHIGIMRVLMAMAYNWDFKGVAPFQIKRNRLFIIQISDAGIHAEPNSLRLVQKLS
ncbi:MAG TPA: histidine phosphatase family protein [Rhodobacteraceae bacterium]|nr:histidine phosphatase family protein [Alphaproteobacteria bacterium]MCH9832818.1 histidine phosphatase family protein [Alphaproteobacteria bacterium]HAB38634.1 histidine phosphatase family protein [Paracoccaceae bacterium]